MIDAMHRGEPCPNCTHALNDGQCQWCGYGKEKPKGVGRIRFKRGEGLKSNKLTPQEALDRAQQMIGKRGTPLSDRELEQIMREDG